MPDTPFDAKADTAVAATALATADKIAFGDVSADGWDTMLAKDFLKALMLVADAAVTLDQLTKFTDGMEVNKGNSAGVIIGEGAGGSVSAASSEGIMIGFFAGAGQTSVKSSYIYIGRHAGYEAAADQSVMIGHACGQYARAADNSVFIGYLAGRNPAQTVSTTSFSSVQIGHEAGSSTTSSENSVLVGGGAGTNATDCIGSVFVGFNAGQAASNAENSVHLGRSAGQNATNSQQSVLIGYQAGKSLSRHHTLVIDSHVTYAPGGVDGLIYGEFDTRWLKVNGGFGGSVQAITGSGAVNLTTLTTNLTGVGPDAMTLADGIHGQIKIVKMVVHGGDSVLTPTTATGFSTITFDAAGDAVVLQYSTTYGWMICSNYGCTVA